MLLFTGRSAVGMGADVCVSKVKVKVKDEKYAIGRHQVRPPHPSTPAPIALECHAESRLDTHEGGGLVARIAGVTAAHLGEHERCATGGVLTPASGLGFALVDRLNRAGMKLGVCKLNEEGDPSEPIHLKLSLIHI